MATHPEGAARLARERYLELTGKVDQFFERVHARYGGMMQCRAGCSACCLAGLSVTSVEANLLREGLNTLPEEVREQLARQARAEAPRACPALDAEGRCLVYAWRPLVCRSHGVPIRQREPVGPPGPEAASTVSACEKNFEGGALLPSLSADCVLDQTTLSTMLGVLDATHADACGTPRGERLSLATLLAERAPSGR
jgi:hypothetical protein